MKQKYDVLVIGGCSAGLYFAERMAHQGFSVLVVEKDEESKLGNRYDIFHLAKDTFSRFKMDEPKEGDSDFVCTFNHAISRSALDRYPKSTFNEVVVLHRHDFMNRLKTSAESKGVTVIHNAKFISPIFDDNSRLSGAKIQHQGKTFDIASRLVADASGIPSVVRSSLQEGYGVENFEIGPKDKFYVVLYYVKLDDPQHDQSIKSCGWPYYKTWIAPQHDPDGVIFGVGANLSFDYAEKCFNRFSDKIKLPKHKVMYIEKGCTPYRRPPYSFVGDGFVALGDAACLTNPWNGEGITAAWVHAEIAAEEAVKALQSGNISQEALWQINKRYYDIQGAEFAQTLSMLAAVVSCTPDENDYEFEKSIIFKGDDEKTEGNLFAKILKGVLVGKIKISTLKNFIKGANMGKKIFNHYKEYPSNPDDLETWVKKADNLWLNTMSIADVAEKDQLT